MTEVRFPEKEGKFLFAIATRPALGPTKPPFQSVPEVLSLEVKKQSREAHHSPSYRAEINVWSHTSTPPYVFMVVVKKFTVFM
jgi:hypothetical protein